MAGGPRVRLRVLGASKSAIQSRRHASCATSAQGQGSLQADVSGPSSLSSEKQIQHFFKSLSSGICGVDRASGDGWSTSTLDSCRVDVSGDVASWSFCSWFWRCDGRRDMDSIVATGSGWYVESVGVRQPEIERNMPADARHAPRAQTPHWEGATTHHFYSVSRSCIFHSYAIACDIHSASTNLRAKRL